MATVLRRVREGFTYAGETDLRILTCPYCGIVYAVPAPLIDNAYSTGNREITWYCPNGHHLGYNGESDEDRAKAQAKRASERATQLRAQLDQTEAALRGQKSRASRFRNERDRERKRAAAGVCPCCNRTFKQLHQHMKTQHPDFIRETLTEQ